MEPLLLVIAFAVIGELVIEALKPALDPLFNRLGLPEDVNLYLYLSLILGVSLAFIYQLDLLAAAGLTDEADVFGIVLTGLFVGRGSNFVHDVISRVGG